MPSPSRRRRTLPLAALLALSVAAPAVARGQTSASVVARATVVSPLAPRLDLSLAAAPSVHTGATAPRRPARGPTELSAAVRVAGNVGYRLFVRARPGAEGALAVRDATGAFRPLTGAPVEVARGSGSEEAPREVVFRAADGTSAVALPVVYELVYDPVS